MRRALGLTSPPPFPPHRVYEQDLRISNYALIHPFLSIFTTIVLFIHATNTRRRPAVFQTWFQGLGEQDSSGTCPVQPGEPSCLGHWESVLLTAPCLPFCPLSPSPHSSLTDLFKTSILPCLKSSSGFPSLLNYSTRASGAPRLTSQPLLTPMFVAPRPTSLLADPQAD